MTAKASGNFPLSAKHAYFISLDIYICINIYVNEVTSMLMQHKKIIPYVPADVWLPKKRSYEIIMVKKNNLYIP